MSNTANGVLQGSLSPNLCMQRHSWHRLVTQKSASWRAAELQHHHHHRSLLHRPNPNLHITNNHQALPHSSKAATNRRNGPQARTGPPSPGVAEPVHHRLLDRHLAREPHRRYRARHVRCWRCIPPQQLERDPASRVNKATDTTPTRPTRPRYVRGTPLSGPSAQFRDDRGLYVMRRTDGQSSA